MRRHPTEAERHLWSMLRDRRLAAHKFRRQVVIAPYIVDFVCFEGRIIIEADGTQHLASDYDARRDACLRGQRFELLRFWNNDVLVRSSAVADAIFAAFADPHPPTAARRAPPSPVKGEGLGAIDA